MLLGVKVSNSQTIIWKQDRLLNWSDFKGKPERRFAVASTVYNIEMLTYHENNNQYTINTYAVFYCKDSWKRKEWISDVILKHEQKHFDLAELYARKMRAELSKLLVKNYAELKLKTDEIYYRLEKEMDKIQDQYDDETEGSMNSIKQLEWENFIASELIKLNKFKDSVVSVNFVN
ncbi:MAG: hypothetical protein ACK5QC_12540 [Bacteroidota bacterium]